MEMLGVLYCSFPLGSSTIKEVKPEAPVFLAVTLAVTYAMLLLPLIPADEGSWNENNKSVVVPGLSEETKELCEPSVKHSMRPLLLSHAASLHPCPATSSSGSRSCCIASSISSKY